MDCYGISGSAMKSNQESLKQLIEYAIITKQRLQLYDSNILTMIKGPLYRKWVQDIIADQYKHEKILKEVHIHYTGKEFIPERVKGAPDTRNLPSQIEQRMEMIFENLAVFHKMCEYTENRLVAQIFKEIIADEHIHGYKLSLIYARC